MALAPLRAIGAAALVLGATACDGAGPERVCTMEFASIPVTILQPGGAPLENATTRVVLVRTGQVLTPQILILYPPGTYTLVDDGSMGVLRPGGDQIRLEAKSGALAAQVEYVIAVPGGCHVRKVSGPDTVQAQYLAD